MSTLSYSDFSLSYEIQKIVHLYPDRNHRDMTSKNGTFVFWLIEISANINGKRGSLLRDAKIITSRSGLIRDEDIEIRFTHIIPNCFNYYPGTFFSFNWGLDFRFRLVFFRPGCTFWTEMNLGWKLPFRGWAIFHRVMKNEGLFWWLRGWFTWKYSLELFPVLGISFSISPFHMFIHELP